MYNVHADKKVYTPRTQLFSHLVRLGKTNERKNGTKGKKAKKIAFTELHQVKWWVYSVYQPYTRFAQQNDICLFLILSVILCCKRSRFLRSNSHQIQLNIQCVHGYIHLYTYCIYIKHFKPASSIGLVLLCLPVCVSVVCRLQCYFRVFVTKI